MQEFPQVLQRKNDVEKKESLGGGGRGGSEGVGLVIARISFGVFLDDRRGNNCRIQEYFSVKPTLMGKVTRLLVRARKDLNRHRGDHDNEH